MTLRRNFSLFGPPLRTRSRLRIWAGTIFFYCRKYLYWYFSRHRFARSLLEPRQAQVIAEHRTPLLRKLNNVEMQLQYNKVHNLGLAIRKLNGLALNPGEIFSYWRLIGRPTSRAGYREGVVLERGQVIAGIGGGLCQLSNLIYWLTLHTPLIVTERWRHGYDVFPDAGRTQPFGSGATCSYPNIDLQIKNPTAQPFQLSLELTATHLVGRWLSSEPSPVRYEVFERDHRIEGNWAGGYTRHNRIFRRVIDCKTGLALREEFVTQNQALMMYEPLLPPSGAAGD